MSHDPSQDAEYQMQQYLESMPRAKNNPMGRSEALDHAIETLEKTIKRLRAFVRFLSLLNPVQYLKWMSDAFAKYVPGKVSASTEQSVPTTMDSYEEQAISKTIESDTEQKIKVSRPVI